MGNEKEQNNKLIILLDLREKTSLNLLFRFLPINYSNQKTDNNNNSKWYSCLEKNTNIQKPLKTRKVIEGVDYPFNPIYKKQPVITKKSQYPSCCDKIMFL